jgi:hemolysin III
MWRWDLQDDAPWTLHHARVGTSSSPGTLSLSPARDASVTRQAQRGDRRFATRSPLDTAPLPRAKPLLRGVSHEVAAWVAAPASLLLVAGAQSTRAQLGAATYGACLIGLFVTSAVFHRPTWKPRTRELLGRLDNAAIFFLIAGTYTPICMLVGGAMGGTLLAVVWGGGALGIALTLAWPAVPKPLMAAVYVLLGWAFVPALGALRAALGPRPLLLVVVGGLVYTAGAVVYARRGPDPFPRVFGYHEIFHALVIAGAVLHFLAVRAAVRALG